jgi:hypothetical protein
MSSKRSISTSIWSDPFFEDLSPSDKLLFVYLITNEKTNMLGIYECSEKKISFETGIDSDTVKMGLKRFERVKKISRVANYIILLNFMKHQKYNTNMKKSALSTYGDLPNDLRTCDLSEFNGDSLKAFETLSNHYGMVPKVEVEGEVELEVELEVEVKTKPTVIHRYAQDVIDCVKNCLVHFDGHLHPKTPKQKLQWCEVVEKLNRIDGIPYQQIEAITEWARNDEFWASNFLALPKLRKKNKDGLLWILVFSEKLKRNDNNKPLSEQQQQIANSQSVHNIIERRKEDRRRAELSNHSTTD